MTDDGHVRRETPSCSTATSGLQIPLKNFYNKRVRIKNFKVGEWVLRKNEASHSEPLGKISVT